MNANSYGWVILFIVCIALLAWVGGEAGFTTTTMPDYIEGSLGYDSEQPVSHNPLEFIGNLAIGTIVGMPLFFTILFDTVPFFLGWIIYRQIRGQD